MPCFKQYRSLTDPACIVAVSPINTCPIFRHPGGFCQNTSCISSETVGTPSQQERDANPLYRIPHPRVYQVAHSGHVWGMTSKQAQHRLAIGEFCDRYGKIAASEIFKVSIRTLYRWRQTLNRHADSAAPPPPPPHRCHNVGVVGALRMGVIYLGYTTVFAPLVGTSARAGLRSGLLYRARTRYVTGAGAACICIHRASHRRPRWCRR